VALAVAGGNVTLSRGALETGLCNMLITDEPTAKALSS